MTTQPEPILCYVSEQWAYFTTQPLDKQNGLNWDLVPHDVYSNIPYELADDDTKQWDVVKLAWDGPFDAPFKDYGACGWSVHQINSGAAPWLSNKNYVSSDHVDVEIYAGTPLSEFKRLIRLGGGEVYVREEENG